MKFRTPLEPANWVKNTFVKGLGLCIYLCVTCATINSPGPKGRFKKKGWATIINTCVMGVILRSLLKNKAPVKEKSLKWTPQVWKKLTNY